MRLLAAARLSVAFSALVFPMYIHAQFQQPTRQELEMTADPSAPGAPAVILYREERTDDNLHYHFWYERIKILSEKGKEAATVHIPYEHGIFKVTDIQGRTIHADGTVVPMTAKPEDLVNVKAKDYQVNTMVFTLPSVEVGSILEYRLQVRYGDEWISSPYWEVQREYFVHKAHYRFEPSRYGGDSLMYAVRVKPGTNVVKDSQGHYTYDVTDVPALPQEDWMPPLNSIRWRIAFYYAPFMNGNEYWVDAGKKWGKKAEHFSNPTKLLQEEVNGLVAAGDTEEQKARKIYAAVMKLDNTSLSRTKTEQERKAENLKEIKDAEEVWKQKSGSANDMALLFVAMCRAAGLKAYPMQVVNRDEAIFDSTYLSMSQLDDYIAVVSINGKDVFVDPGQKVAPFGLLRWNHTMAGGLRMTDKGAGLAMTPANTYSQNTEQRVGDVTLDSNGQVTGSVRYVLTGQGAVHWRREAIENDEDEVKKRFNEEIRGRLPDGVEANFDHFLALDDYASNLIAVVKVSGVLATATGKHVFLPGQLFASHAEHPFVKQDKREIPIDVQYPRRVLDSVTYHLPAGWTLESAPPATKVPLEGKALLQMQSKPTADGVVVERSLVYNYTVLGPSEYAGIHDFYQKVAAADQQQLVLSRAPAGAKGE